VNPIELKLFSSRLQAICDEMGGVLRRSAFSPNIKDRLDFSCALFASDGSLAAQAAHIPVHLGSMAYTMKALVSSRDWQEGEVLVVNDPYLGGTHLPDVTLVAPVYEQSDFSAEKRLLGFVANRAHHANIGCETPGSMPLSRTIKEEGVLISPSLLRSGFASGGALLSCGTTIDALLYIKPSVLSGDFAAQLGANELAVARLQQLAESYGYSRYGAAIAELNRYAAALAGSAFAEIEEGKYCAVDYLDDDGFGSGEVELALTLECSAAGLSFDFSASSDQVEGNLNCPEAVAAAAAYYCHCCLLPEGAPLCAGLFEGVEVRTRPGSLVNPLFPAAVAAGNVETAMRLVDLIFRALADALPQRIPAASQGSMNNVAMGVSHPSMGWDYYETLAGGEGAGPRADGRNAIHTHMTNTLNTPVESLEYHYPLRLTQYAIRRGSGGAGSHRGGEGLLREYEFLQPATLSLLTERRRLAPWGLAGGEAAALGENHLNGKLLPGKGTYSVEAGDRLLIATPGGGGWGRPI
jgi:N-methylhydantoinase B